MGRITSVYGDVNWKKSFMHRQYKDLYTSGLFGGVRMLNAHALRSQVSHVYQSLYWRWIEFFFIFSSFFANSHYLLEWRIMINLSLLFLVEFSSDYMLVDKFADWSEVPESCCVGSARGGRGVPYRVVPRRQSMHPTRQACHRHDPRHTACKED